MSVHIALLRGVNLAGHRQVAMADLRRWLSDLGFEDARTLLQSGNLLFRGGRRQGPSLEKFLEAEAERRLGLATDFMVRTPAQWDEAIARNPFPREAAATPARLVIAALKGPPTRAAVTVLEKVASKGPEKVHVTGDHLYVFFPEGIGVSKLRTDVIDRALGVRGTARNWNTVLKIQAMARG